MTKPAMVPESYGCGACGVVVVVDVSGRWWDAERAQWLCIKCFDVGRPTVAETDARMEAVMRRNRGQS